MEDTLKLRTFLNIIGHFIFEYENDLSIVVFRLHLIASQTYLISWVNYSIYLNRMKSNWGFWKRQSSKIQKSCSCSILYVHANLKVSHIHSTLSLSKSSLQVKHLLPDSLSYLKMLSHFNEDFSCESLGTFLLLCNLLLKFSQQGILGIFVNLGLVFDVLGAVCISVSTKNSGLMNLLQSI